MVTIPDVGAILNVLANAQNAVRGAVDLINTIRDAGIVLTSDSEDDINERLASLRADLDTLETRVQAKLRGISTNTDPG